jgi:hypothetical protein
VALTAQVASVLIRAQQDSIAGEHSWLSFQNHDLRLTEQAMRPPGPGGFSTQGAAGAELMRVLPSAEERPWPHSHMDSAADL